MAIVNADRHSARRRFDGGVQGPPRYSMCRQLVALAVRIAAVYLTPGANRASAGGRGVTILVNI